MRIEYNGIRKNVPDDAINRIMKGLDCTKDEAIQIWLEDEEVIINTEQKALDDKAKASDVTRTIHDAISQKVVDKHMATTTEKKKTTKPQPDKEKLINSIKTLLEGMCANSGGSHEDVTVVNPTKVIQFVYNGKPYKIDLTATRVK